MADRAEYVFAVNEDSEGKCWIIAEPRHEGLEVLRSAILGFQLREGISSVEADQLARAMTDNIANITYAELQK